MVASCPRHGHRKPTTVRGPHTDDATTAAATQGRRGGGLHALDGDDLLEPAPLHGRARPLPEGTLWCELPAGHRCPHRASGPPHCPPGAEPAAWAIETPWRCVVRRGRDAVGAAWHLDDSAAPA